MGVESVSIIQSQIDPMLLPQENTWVTAVLIVVIIIMVDVTGIIESRIAIVTRIAGAIAKEIATPMVVTGIGATVAALLLGVGGTRLIIVGAGVIPEVLQGEAVLEVAIMMLRLGAHLLRMSLTAGKSYVALSPVTLHDLSRVKSLEQ